MYQVNFWVFKPVLSEVIGQAETSDEARQIIVEHDLEHHVCEHIPDYYFVEEI